MEPAGWPERYTSHPHNLLLDLWLSVGILGLAAFCWLVVCAVGLARGARSADSLIPLPMVAGASGALVAGLVHGLVDNGFLLPDLAVMTWLFLAYLERSGGGSAGG